MTPRPWSGSGPSATWSSRATGAAAAIALGVGIILVLATSAVNGANLLVDHRVAPGLALTLLQASEPVDPVGALEAEDRLGAENGDLGLRERALADLVRVTGGDHLARLRYGLLLLEVDRARGIEMLQEAKAGPYFLQLADRDGAEGQNPAVALGDLQVMADIEPGSPTPWSRMATLEVEMGQGSQGAADYDHAAGLEPPGSAASLFLQGEAATARGATRDALQLYQEAAAAGMSAAYVQAGISARQAGLLGTSDSLLRQATSLRTEDATAHLELARTLAAESDCSSARKEARTSLRLLQDQVGPWILMAQCDQAQGKLSAARSDLRSALDLQPSSPDAWLALGQLDQAQGRAGAAYCDVRRAAQLAPGAVAYAQALAALRPALCR